jgi:hypothetical protein
MKRVFLTTLVILGMTLTTGPVVKSADIVSADSMPGLTVVSFELLDGSGNGLRAGRFLRGDEGRTNIPERFVDALGLHLANWRSDRSEEVWIGLSGLFSETGQAWKMDTELPLLGKVSYLQME